MNSRGCKKQVAVFGLLLITHAAEAAKRVCYVSRQATLVAALRV
ncbi:MAG TPA: hypothetical protein VE262_22025 [Blastocatellia bacterium]|nr:hypothetical protein [Blastocatellia bacterium]